MLVRIGTYDVRAREICFPTFEYGAEVEENNVIVHDPAILGRIEVG
jgi:hypothetical protein